MCMDTLHNIKRRHRIGFKVVKNTSTENEFESFIMGATYVMNEWYDVGDPKFLMDINTSYGKKTYKGGIHYFRVVPDSESTVVINNPVDYAIIKVKLKGIIATGNEQLVEAGVARMACPVQIISGNMTLKDYQSQNLKKHIKLTDGQFYIDLFKNATSMKAPTPKEVDIICERAIRSPKAFSQYVLFIDMFNRRHDVFNFFTRGHVSIDMNRLSKHKKYREYYRKLVMFNKGMHKYYSELMRQRKKLGIRIINGPVA